MLLDMSRSPGLIQDRSRETRPANFQSGLKIVLCSLLSRHCKLIGISPQKSLQSTKMKNDLHIFLFPGIHFAMTYTPKRAEIGRTAMCYWTCPGVQGLSRIGPGRQVLIAKTCFDLLIFNQTVEQHASLCSNETYDWKSCVLLANR